MLRLHEFVQNEGVPLANMELKSHIFVQSTLALNVTLLDIYQTLREMNSLANPLKHVISQFKMDKNDFITVIQEYGI